MPSWVKELTVRIMDLVDARLIHVVIRRWTHVGISDQHAVEAISLYLRMNQPWWAFLDRELFFDDLVSGYTDFCSHILVNALLAWSTVSPPKTIDPDDTAIDLFI
jgi:hypothetical protein